MSVLAISEGDLFTVRITKYLATNPANKWANSYEFQCVSATTEASLLLLANHLVLFEVPLHGGLVTFDRALISTWEPDSKPYDPTTFISSTLTAVGTIGNTTNILPLDKTLSIARVAGYGRVGHLFFRGTLSEADVSAPAGVSILDDRSDWQDQIDAALTSSGLEDYIGSPPAEDFGMVMINKAGTQVRPVIQLRAQGVGTVPTDHAWFNRTSPTP